MSEYFFGVGNGQPTKKNAKRIDRIAKKHDAAFVCVRLAGDGDRH